MSNLTIHESESEAVVQAKEGEHLFAMVIVAEGRLWVFPYMNLRFCEANNYWLDLIYHSHTIRIEGDRLQGSATWLHCSACVAFDKVAGDPVR